MILLLADSHGIGRIAGGALVTARVWDGPAFVPPSVIDLSNGSVAVQFALQVQGTYQVSPAVLCSIMRQGCEEVLLQLRKLQL